MWRIVQHSGLVRRSIRRTKPCPIAQFHETNLSWHSVPPPQYIEELALGGGYSDAEDGGAEIEKVGTIRTNGPIAADGDITSRDARTTPTSTWMALPVQVANLFTTSPARDDGGSL